MAITQPVWSRVDEAQHADFIIQLSHGVYPLADRTVIDPETLRVTQSTGVYRFEAPGSYPIPDASDIASPPPAMSPHNNAVWMSRHLWQLSYESAQTPGYYVLMVPVWRLADQTGGTVAAIYVMRIINALLIALLAPMAVVVARRLAPGSGEVAALAALFAIVLPGLDLNATRVGNDALAAVLGGGAIVMSIRWIGGAWSTSRALLLGLVLGAGVLVKLTLIGLTPAVAIAMLWPAAGIPWRRRVGLLLITGALVAACLAIWFAINLNLYGVPVPSGRTNRLSIVPPTAFDWRLVPFSIAFFVISYWSGEPLGVLPYAAGFVVLGLLITLVAAAGFIKRWSIEGPALVAIAAAAGMLAVALLLPATAAFQFAGPGRYEYPALPAVAALTAVGVTALLVRAFASRALAGLYGVAALAILVAGGLGVGAEQLGAGSGSPPSEATIVTTQARSELGNFSISADKVAMDQAGHATWVRVTVSNAGPDEAEWNPAAAVDGVTADYARSTQLPGDLEPRASVSGWIYFGLEAHRGQTLALRFRDVAQHSYAEVGDVVLQVSV
jgi:hypothetical protein